MSVTPITRLTPAPATGSSATCTATDHKRLETPAGFLATTAAGFFCTRAAAGLFLRFVGFLATTAAGFFCTRAAAGLFLRFVALLDCLRNDRIS